MVLEVIASCVEDALEAQRGGAHRLELVRDLDVGGLTPPIDLVSEIVASVSIPVHVMLRERNDFFAGDEQQRRQLCELARALSGIPISGLVFGFLENDRLDLEMTARILEIVSTSNVTLHHAFEETDPLNTIRELKNLKQVNRILTHGGRGDWHDKAANLVRYQEAAFPDIQILVGGGLNAERISWLSRTSNLSEFHVGRAARHPSTSEGRVLSDKVRILVDSMKETV